MNIDSELKFASSVDFGTITYAFKVILNMLAQLFGGTRGIKFNMLFHLHPYRMYTNSGGSR